MKLDDNIADNYEEQFKFLFFDDFDAKLKEFSHLMCNYMNYSCRPPETIKKDIKHEKNPMRLKQLNQELNKSYKIYRTRRK